MTEGPDREQASADLIRAALDADGDEEKRWEFVVELHSREDVETRDLLAELLRSPEASERTLGADALGQFGTSRGFQSGDPRPFADATFNDLMTAAHGERDPRVIDAIATALGHSDDDRAVPTLAAWRTHPDEPVRYAVTMALGGNETDLAVDTLLELMVDPSDNVRDWATFGLGVIGSRDDERIRQALLAQLDDPHDQVRVEALVSLARRGDTRALPHLRYETQHLKRLEDWGPVSDAIITMAAATGDEALCAFVEEERVWWETEAPNDPLPEDLTAALAACQANRDSRR
jgi:HEAT repeat protein